MHDVARLVLPCSFLVLSWSFRVLAGSSPLLPCFLKLLPRFFPNPSLFFPIPAPLACSFLILPCSWVVPSPFAPSSPKHPCSLYPVPCLSFPGPVLLLLVGSLFFPVPCLLVCYANLCSAALVEKSRWGIEYDSGKVKQKLMLPSRQVDGPRQLTPPTGGMRSATVKTLPVGDWHMQSYPDHLELPVQMRHTWHRSKACAGS